MGGCITINEYCFRPPDGDVLRRRHPLLLAYAAFRIGKVGVVAPILCTEGAIAATISGLAGESIAPMVIFLLLVIVGGVVLAAIAPDPVPVENEQPLKAALIATTGAVIFGIGLFATGNISGELPLEWILLPAWIGENWK